MMNIASLDMAPEDYEAAPTWVEAGDIAVPADEIIRIAVTAAESPALLRGRRQCWRDARVRK